MRLWRLIWCICWLPKLLWEMADRELRAQRTRTELVADARIYVRERLWMDE